MPRKTIGQNLGNGLWFHISLLLSFKTPRWFHQSRRSHNSSLRSADFGRKGDICPCLFMLGNFMETIHIGSHLYLHLYAPKSGPRGRGGASLEHSACCGSTQKQLEQNPPLRKPTAARFTPLQISDETQKPSFVVKSALGGPAFGIPMSMYVIPWAHVQLCSIQSSL